MFVPEYFFLPDSFILGHVLPRQRVQLVKHLVCILVEIILATVVSVLTSIVHDLAMSYLMDHVLFLFLIAVDVGFESPLETSLVLLILRILHGRV